MTETQPSPAPGPTPDPTVTSGGSLRGSSLVNLAGAAASAASTLLLVVLTARVLDPDDAGLVFGVTSGFLILAAVLRSGTPTAAVLFISRRGTHSPAEDAQVARMATRPVLVASAVVAVLALPFAGVLARVWGLQDGAEGVATILVLLATLPAAAVLDSALAVSRGGHDMRPTVVVDRFARPLAQLVLTAAAAFSPSLLTVTAAWCLPYLGAAVAAYALTPALRSRPVLAPPPALRREFRSFVAQRGVATIIQVSFARLDIVLVAALAGPTEAAVYTAATRFVTLCQFVQQAIATAGEPALARALGLGRTDQALHVYRTTTVWLVALLWPVLLGVAALAPEWLRIFGSAYVDGVDVVVVLAIAMLLATGVGMVETVLNMAGRAGLLVGTNAAALVAMVVIDVVLVPGSGSFGAAIGWAVAIAVKNLTPLARLHRTVHGSPLSRSWWLAAAVNVGLLGLLPVAAAVTGHDALRVVVTLAGGVGVLVAYVVLRTPLRLDQLFGRARADVPAPVGVS